jgi:hypothetical protein
VTRAEELGEKVSREISNWTTVEGEKVAAAALSELVADAEALAEALDRLADSLDHEANLGDGVIAAYEDARDALARYRGEKP